MKLRFRSLITEPALYFGLTLVAIGSLTGHLVYMIVNPSVHPEPWLSALSVLGASFATLLSSGFGAILVGGTVFDHVRPKAAPPREPPKEVGPQEDPLALGDLETNLADAYNEAFDNEDLEGVKYAAQVAVPASAQTEHLRAVQNLFAARECVREREFLDARVFFARVEEEFLPAGARARFRDERALVCEVLDVLKRVDEGARLRCGFNGESRRDFYRLLLAAYNDGENPHVVVDAVRALMRPYAEEFFLIGIAHEHLGAVDQAIDCYRRGAAVATEGSAVQEAIEARRTDLATWGTRATRPAAPSFEEWMLLRSREGVQIRFVEDEYVPSPSHYTGRKLDDAEVEELLRGLDPRFLPEYEPAEPDQPNQTGA